MNAPEKRADQLEAGDLVETEDGPRVVKYVYRGLAGNMVLLHFEGGEIAAADKGDLCELAVVDP